jgi:2-iminobutanoate/2-iminopropanoate deaminase
MSNRHVVNVSGSPEHPLELVRLGDLAFTSSITGAEGETGALSKQPEEQFEQAFANLARLLKAAGLTPEDLGLVTVNIPNASFRPNINPPWLKLFPNDDSRPARKTNQYALPGGQVIQLQAVAVPGQARRALKIPGFEHRDPLPAGVRIGDYVFSSVIGGTDASGAQVKDPPGQMRQAFHNMESLIKDAGGSKDDMLHCYVFLRDKSDQELLIETWLEEFPVDGDRPARKTIPYDELKGRETLVQLQLHGVIGQGKRRNFEVSGVAHHDPIPLACGFDHVVWSSGISGMAVGDESERSLDEQCAFAFNGLRGLTKQYGGSPDNIVAMTWLIKDYADLPGIMKHFDELFPNPADKPALHVQPLGSVGRNKVQLHQVAVL